MHLEPSGRPGTIIGVWQALIVCSSCAEEVEVVVEDLDDLERQVCTCGYSCGVLSIATFEPIYSEGAELIKLPAPRKLPLAA
jgi:hypothetical protein